MILSVVMTFVLGRQQVERVNDPQFIPTGREAVLEVGNLWMKHDGKWGAIPNGRWVTTEKDGSYEGHMNLRIKAAGFRKGEDRYCLLTVMYYDLRSRNKGKDWWLLPNTYRLLNVALKGPFGTQPAEGEAGTWNLPLLGSWTLNGDGFDDFSPDGGKIWSITDRYAVKSFTAKLNSGELLTKSPETLAWPVYPVRPKAGPVVRYQFPIESYAGLEQGWDSFYFETSPKAWTKFTTQMSIMVGDTAPI